MLDRRGQRYVQLRVFVKGGGCAGMRHKFSLTARPDGGDVGMYRLGVRLVVDPLSLMYLSGSVVDCGAGVGDSCFVVYHPRAGTVCTCGASFAPQFHAPPARAMAPRPRARPETITYTPSRVSTEPHEH
ncbi:Iron-sulfur cluster insertion protein ErpA [Candidatus Tremblaya princeps]|uniref:Iron-sulfur cluster insertion protein ErpA n=1 Tax=Tremblaya princeps TaxID=189385 RepID=A0A143WP16_TREPR|nr:Iron-sulfur cluster insertion protein ErpA [Candidatus Tremblaya princeps]